MARKTLPYREGDWFAVPLAGGGYALGRAARVSRGGIVLGYFFSPRHKLVPTEAHASGLTSANAVGISMFGDLGLIRGGWPIVRNTGYWSRAEWPLPEFGRIELIDRTVAYRTAYDENDLSQYIRETRVSPEEAQLLPRDCLRGYLSMADLLDDLLD